MTAPKTRDKEIADLQDDVKFARGSALFFAGKFKECERALASEREKRVLAEAQRDSYERLFSMPFDAALVDLKKRLEAAETARNELRQMNAEQNQRIVDAEEKIANLLARIFRDGGQKQSTFKTIEAACAAADELVANTYARLEEAERDRRKP